MSRVATRHARPRRQLRVAARAAWLAWAVLAPAPGVAADGDPPPDPVALLREAFANQYEVDTTARIELVIRNRSGQERRRSFRAASRILDDRLHAIGRLERPEHLRGMTILQVENADRSHDAFVYLPSMHAVRRVSAAQRGDSFFGTDLTYEDLERRDVADYEVLEAWRDASTGEDAFVVEARPRRPRSYARLRFWIAAADRALLQVHFFKRGAETPFRTLAAPRAGMLRAQGHTLPTQIEVSNRARGTTTEIRYHDLRVNPEIGRRVFSVQTLERGGRIPGAPR